jgi:hypothetical protein
MTTRTVSFERPYGKRRGLISTRAETEAGILIRVNRIANATLSKINRLMSVVGKDLPFHEPETHDSLMVQGGTDIFFALKLPDEELEYADNGTLFEHLEKIMGMKPKVFEDKLAEIVSNLWSELSSDKEVDIHSVLQKLHVCSTINL